MDWESVGQMSTDKARKKDGSPGVPSSPPPIPTINDGRTLIEIHTAMTGLQKDIEHIKGSLSEIKESFTALNGKVSRLEGQRNIVLGVLMTIVFIGTVTVGAVTLADKIISMRDKAAPATEAPATSRPAK